MAKVPQVKLKIDFKEIFGDTIPDDQALREAIGGAIIDRIRERTQSGVDKNGRAFKKYSESYKESLAFKAYGKSPGKVDMTLTGDMLGNMDIISQNKNSITIGFPDATDNAKAFNHTTGDTLPKRDFFGLPKSELQSIASDFQDTIQNFEEVKNSEGESFRENALKALKDLLG